MTVNGHGTPAKCLELLLNPAIADDFLNGAVNLEVVVIHESDYMVQSVVCACHGCFPDLALFNLPIPQQAVHIVVLMVQPAAQGNAVGNGQSLAQDPVETSTPGVLPE